VKVVVASLSTEQHKLARPKIDIGLSTIGRPEVHRDSAQQGKRHKDLFKGAVSVYMRRYSLARRVVVDCQLVEETALIKHC